MDETEKKLFIAGAIISLILIPILRKIRVLDLPVKKKIPRKKNSRFFSGYKGNNRYPRKSSTHAILSNQQCGGSTSGGYQSAIPAFGEYKPFQVYNRTVPFPSNPFTSQNGMMMRSASAQMMNDYTSRIIDPNLLRSWSSEFSESFSSNESPTGSPSFDFIGIYPGRGDWRNSVEDNATFNYKDWSEQRLMLETGLLLAGKWHSLVYNSVGTKQLKLVKNIYWCRFAQEIDILYCWSCFWKWSKSYMNYYWRTTERDLAAWQGSQHDLPTDKNLPRIMTNDIFILHYTYYSLLLIIFIYIIHF